jgi:heme O synthase-like polyprenyltransferase
MDWTDYLGTQLLGINAPGTTLPIIIGRVIDILLVLAGVVAVVYIIIGGYQYVTSAGNAEQAGQAKNTVLYAIIGLVIIFAAFLIVNFVLGRLRTGA